MTKKEMRMVSKQMLAVYSGILFHNQTFRDGNEDAVVYEFDGPAFGQLRSKYQLEQMAGQGSDFTRAKRLLHALAPRLTHSSWYDNHIACNALDLLAYSLDNPRQGINCLSKAKILAECCLSLGIYARRVRIMPYSPYDFDNHVVTEIYDRALEKWIMLDLTTDGYFIDETKTPLSLLEMRHKFANAEFVTFVATTDSLKDLNRLREKYVQNNSYICKNLFYFCVEKYATFGEKGEYLEIVPEHCFVKRVKEENLKYRLDNLPEECAALRENLAQRLRETRETAQQPPTSMVAMQRRPI